MTLREKQSLFLRLLPRLIDYAHANGYELTGGDLYRDERCAYGAAHSQHRKRLAVDLNLFRDGEWLTGTEDHRFLGEYWESLCLLCRWGGRFPKPDGNHYELRG